MHEQNKNKGLPSGDRLVLDLTERRTPGASKSGREFVNTLNVNRATMAQVFADKGKDPQAPLKKALLMPDPNIPDKRSADTELVGALGEEFGFKLDYNLSLALRGQLPEHPHNRTVAVYRAAEAPAVPGTAGMVLLVRSTGEDLEGHWSGATVYGSEKDMLDDLMPQTPPTAA